MSDGGKDDGVRAYETILVTVYHKTSCLRNLCSVMEFC